EPHCGALAEAAHDLEAAAVLLDVALGDREAQPGALLPGREERLAHRREHLLGDPATRIAYLDDYGATWGAVASPRAVGDERTDPEPPARGHGGERVGDDLENGLLQLGRIDMQLGER